MTIVLRIFLVLSVILQLRDIVFGVVVLEVRGPHHGETRHSEVETNHRIHSVLVDDEHEISTTFVAKYIVAQTDDVQNMSLVIEELGLVEEVVSLFDGEVRVNARDDEGVVVVIIDEFGEFDLFHSLSRCYVRCG